MHTSWGHTEVIDIENGLRPHVDPQTFGQLHLLRPDLKQFADRRLVGLSNAVNVESRNLPKIRCTFESGLYSVDILKVIHLDCQGSRGGFCERIIKPKKCMDRDSIPNPSRIIAKPRATASSCLFSVLLSFARVSASFVFLLSFEDRLCPMV